MAFKTWRTYSLCMIDNPKMKNNLFNSDEDEEEEEYAKQ